MTVREMRKIKGISQEELAKALGVTRQCISMIETAKNNLQVERAMEIAKVLDCDWTIFFEDKSNLKSQSTKKR